MRSWRWKYRVAGREKVLTIGKYPEVTLAQARSTREAAARELGNGFDPARVKKQQAEATFESFARAWHKQQQPSWSVGHARNVLNSLIDEAFPRIGHLPIAKITPAHILEVLRPMERRGAVDQAHRVRQRMSDVFVLAISSGMAETDPAAIVRKALSPLVKRNYPALTNIAEARALLEADAALKGWPITKLASRLLAITAARSEALRFAEWHEFEDLTGPSPIWRIPASKMKLGMEKRKQAALEFIIPLSRQAVEIVQLARYLTEPGPYLFPNVRLPHKPMSENAISVRYRALPAFAGRHVPHGWRSSFSTIMNERVQERGAIGDRAIIDLMLAHQPQGVEPIYNRAAYMDRRREIAQEWADLLCEGITPIRTLLELPRN